MVLKVELNGLTEGDLAWGRLATRDMAEGPSSVPFYDYLDGNKDLAGEFPGPDALETA